jgi:hypothetical protein
VTHLWRGFASESRLVDINIIAVITLYVILKPLCSLLLLSGIGRTDDEACATKSKGNQSSERRMSHL